MQREPSGSPASSENFVCLESESDFNLHSSCGRKPKSHFSAPKGKHSQGGVLTFREGQLGRVVPRNEPGGSAPRGLPRLAPRARQRFCSFMNFPSLLRFFCRSLWCFCTFAAGLTRQLPGAAATPAPTAPGSHRAPGPAARSGRSRCGRAAAAASPRPPRCPPAPAPCAVPRWPRGTVPPCPHGSACPPRPPCPGAAARPPSPQDSAP